MKSEELLLYLTVLAMAIVALYVAYAFLSGWITIYEAILVLLVMLLALGFLAGAALFMVRQRRVSLPEEQAEWESQMAAVKAPQITAPPRSEEASARGAQNWSGYLIASLVGAILAGSLAAMAMRDIGLLIIVIIIGCCLGVLVALAWPPRWDTDAY